jgi:aminoglycoside 3-N-acetyltransferase I
MSVEIRKLNGHDIDLFKELILLFEVVFEMENFQLPHDNHLQQLLKKESFFVFVALTNDKVVGGSTSYTLQQYYSVSPLVYIYDMAVKTSFQRQGIGKKLISALLTYCKEIGIEEVFVQADEVDAHAIEFYRSTGGKPEKVVHFNYPLNT